MSNTATHDLAAILSRVHGLDLLGRIGAFFAMFAEARRAAWVYEALDNLTDGDLARRGLQREDVAWIAARELNVR